MKYIQIKKLDGQKFLDLIHKKLRKIRIVNPDFKIEKEGDFIQFPIIPDNLKYLIPDLNEIHYKIVEKNGNPRLESAKKNMTSYLRDILPKKILSLIPKSYDIIGDVAIIEFDRLDKLEEPKLHSYKKEIAQALLDINKSVKTVYEKESEVSGTFRVRDLRLILGIDHSETLHKENKTIYKLDVKNVFFSPRLVYERERISNQPFIPNEIIVDMFAGVGPFSIQIAKKNPVQIFAFDVNPIAFRYLEENIEINKVKDKINIYNIDVKQLIKPGNQIGNNIHNQIDRIIMNLPEMNFNFLDVTCFSMKNSGGILHFYSFSDKKNAFKATKKKLSYHLEENGFKIDSVKSQRVVKGYSPSTDLIVMDCFIKSS
ncbi:MAG: class I SAM-dependent methyltransferase family protein [Promethearchaeota archaeon]|nr:MAG: class I SAM-dependent methyltransferase family protein [Candidatus Lokiarchaeota archaeon]